MWMYWPMHESFRVHFELVKGRFVPVNYLGIALAAGGTRFCFCTSAILVRGYAWVVLYICAYVHKSVSKNVALVELKFVLVVKAIDMGMPSGYILVLYSHQKFCQTNIFLHFGDTFDNAMLSFQ